jgi:hypothetical protein
MDGALPVLKRRKREDEDVQGDEADAEIEFINQPQIMRTFVFRMTGEAMVMERYFHSLETGRQIVGTTSVYSPGE